MWHGFLAQKNQKPTIEDRKVQGPNKNPVPFSKRHGVEGKKPRFIALAS
jgi:hypothetical protein